MRRDGFPGFELGRYPLLRDVAARFYQSPVRFGRLAVYRRFESARLAEAARPAPLYGAVASHTYPRAALSAQRSFHVPSFDSTARWSHVQVCVPEQGSQNPSGWLLAQFL